MNSINISTNKKLINGFGNLKSDFIFKKICNIMKKINYSKL